MRRRGISAWGYPVAEAVRRRARRGRTQSGGRELGARSAYFNRLVVVTGPRPPGEAAKLAAPAGPRNRSAERRLVRVGPEAHQQLAVRLEHRPLDHRGVGLHQVDGLGLVDPLLVGL